MALARPPALFFVQGPVDADEEVSPDYWIIHQAFETTSGLSPVHLSHSPPNALRNALDRARAVSHDAFVALAKPGDAAGVLEQYQGDIAEILKLTAAARDPESRGLLWNVCLLRAQLVLMTAGPHASATQSSVDQCVRQFPDQSAFSRAWSQDVVELFKSYDAPRVSVSVRSAPAGCDVRVFGGAVGVTPLRLRLLAGRQEIQVVCGKQESLVHAVDATRSVDVVIRPGADRAWSSAFSTASQLSYEDGAAAVRAADDAAVLSTEVGAVRFVLARMFDDGPVLHAYEDSRWVSSVRVPPGSTHEEVVGLVSRLYAQDDEIPAVVAREAADTRQQVRRDPAVFANSALGAGLIAAGVGLSAYPVFALSRDDAGGGAWGAFGAAAALVTSGVLVLTLRPLIQRESTVVVVGPTGASVRGSF